MFCFAGRIAVLVVAGAVVGCSSSAPELEHQTSPIVNGERTMNNENSVVAVLNRAGGLCTGTLISPRVVLTARHCVQFEGSSGPSAPSAFVIGIGDRINGLSQTFGASDVVTTEGRYTRLQDIIGRDIALITLTTQPALTPIPVARESASRGQDTRAVGFGETPAGGAGVKYRTTSTVSNMDSGVIYTPPTICQGDSGGPLLTLDEEVLGVASFGSGACGSGINGYNRVDIWLDMIDDAIRASGVCVGDGTEVCDGEDNDCDELFDEDCTAVGDPCVEDDECISLSCAAFGGSGRICTQGCDPQRPQTGCPPGMYCSNAGGCEGLCAPGDAGGAANDADCAVDTDCASLFCADPGDGRTRCLLPCRGDEGMCLDGEACAAAPGSCGGCVPAGIVAGDRGLGEPCSTDDECGSALCFMEAGVSYCSRPCTEDAGCAEEYHCRVEAEAEAGVCVRGSAGGIGNTCISNGDCEAPLFCATRADLSWCTNFCDVPEDCPPDFACEGPEGSSVCAPDRGISGASCDGPEDCISGSCQPVGEDGELLCTRLCGPDSLCELGFACARAADGISSVCVPVTEETTGGGGGCTVGGATPPSWSLLLVLLFVRRRNR